jgi:hypothetical protein
MLTAKDIPYRANKVTKKTKGGALVSVSRVITNSEIRSHPK